MKVKHLLIAGFCCLLQMEARSQTESVRYLQFDPLTVNDGLSQGLVLCIIQDHYGFMWFCTKDGLNRYDGYQLKVFRHDPSDSTSIAENYIQCIYEDAKGRLWVGTSSKGLDLFDRETETFRHFPHVDKNSNSINSNTVYSIRGNQEGILWLQTDRGICTITPLKNENNQLSQFSFKDLKIRANILVAHNGTVWVSQYDDGLLYRIYKKKNGAEVRDTIPFEKFSSSVEQNTTISLVVQNFMEDTTRHKIYLIFNEGVTTYDEVTGQFDKSETGPSGGYGSYTFSGNKLWLIVNYRAVQYDPDTWQLSFIQDQSNPGDEMPAVSCLYSDRSGVIWMGTTGYGILKHNPRTVQFHFTPSISTGWMHQTNDGRVMIVESSKTARLFDPHTGTFTGLLPDSSIAVSADYERMGYISAAVQNPSGLYWLLMNYLVSYDPGTKKIVPYPIRVDFPLYQNEERELWFRKSDSICRFDETTHQQTCYQFPIPSTGGAYWFLQSIYHDDQGILWLGTIRGLLRFDPHTQSWKHFANVPNDSSSLSFDLIFSLCPDPLQPDRYLWIGTAGGGLNRLDKQSEKMTHYSMNHGLPNNVIYGILSDSTGNLWMSTDKGLSKFNVTTGASRNYDVAEGLQSNEYNRYSFCKTKGGILFFGGIRGFNYFNPKEIQDNTVVPQVLITGFKIVNQPVLFSPKSTTTKNESPISKPVYLTDKIVLPYKDNMISFEFAALDFRRSEKNSYQYRMEGFDKDWIQAGTDRVATYTNLDPGTYRFTVLGSNSDGVWNKTGKSIQIIILPPWYMTWWFRIGIALAVTGVLYAFYRYRLQQALKLLSVRNRIAQDLHDEIGSNLSNISIFSEVAQERSGESDSVNPLLRKISDYTQSSQEAMSDIVWMINAHNDRFENIIIRMRALAAELCEAKNFKLQLHFDERLNAVKLGMEERKNFYLIYKEAINNIAKYADCKNVWIEMTLHHASVSLIIKDDGKGFQQNGSNPGNGLVNMKRRAELLQGVLQINSEPGKGTAIELKFGV